MTSEAFRCISTAFSGSFILVFCSGILAVEQGRAEQGIVNSNVGLAARWVIDSLKFESGGEYLVINEDLVKRFVETI